MTAPALTSVMIDTLLDVAGAHNLLNVAPAAQTERPDTVITVDRCDLQTTDQLRAALARYGHDMAPLAGHATLGRRDGVTTIAIHNT
ncbi:hypothetical protein AB0395_34810 [Streptosporangium sp. NPDC051023]|uniref:hypothetical protein n=1 Tax=Streptosporangium sp. NPDC051023 TaxID=3155410 RepID=UPI00344EBB15